MRMRNKLNRHFAIINKYRWRKGDDGSEYTALEGGVLTLRTIKVEQFESMATLVMRFDFTQTRKRFSGTDIAEIKKEALVWAQKEIVEMTR